MSRSRRGGRLQPRRRRAATVDAPQLTGKDRAMGAALLDHLLKTPLVSVGVDVIPLLRALMAGIQYCRIDEKQIDRFIKAAATATEGEDRERGIAGLHRWKASAGKAAAVLEKAAESMFVGVGNSDPEAERSIRATWQKLGEECAAAIRKVDE